MDRDRLGDDRGAGYSLEGEGKQKQNGIGQGILRASF